MLAVSVYLPCTQMRVIEWMYDSRLISGPNHLKKELRFSWILRSGLLQVIENMNKKRRRNISVYGIAFGWCKVK